MKAGKQGHGQLHLEGGQIVSGGEWCRFGRGAPEHQSIIAHKVPLDVLLSVRPRSIPSSGGRTCPNPIQVSGVANVATTRTVAQNRPKPNACDRGVSCSP